MTMDTLCNSKNVPHIWAWGHFAPANKLLYLDMVPSVYTCTFCACMFQLRLIHAYLYTF